MDALDDLLVKRYSELVPEKPARLTTTFEIPAHVVESASDDDKPIEDKPVDDTVVEKLGEEHATAPGNETTSAPASPTLEPAPDLKLAECPPTSDTTLDEFKPAWEVDRFQWPAICGDVEEHLETDLISAVETIQRECLQRGDRIVAVTNSEIGSGATTVALCLAREAARQGKRVALVDLNHERPSLMESLGIDCEHGIESLPLAEVDAEDICVAAIEDGVSLVPLLKPIDAEHGASQPIRDLLGRLAATHDLVLLDTTKTMVARLTEASPTFGIGVISVMKSSTDENSSPSSTNGNSWSLGTIRNFAA